MVLRRLTHLDLSYAAFDQIAIRHRGVVDLKVRPADCDKQASSRFTSEPARERGSIRARATTRNGLEGMTIGVRTG